MVDMDLIEKWEAEEKMGFEIIDVTDDECEITAKLDTMTWLEFTPTFKGDFLSIDVTLKGSEVISNLCDMVTITGGSQILCKLRGATHFTVWEAMVDRIYLHNDGVEFALKEKC